MKVHFISHTTALATEHVGGGKVGGEVKVQQKVEEDQTRVRNTQQSENTLDKPVMNELGVNLQFAVDKETGTHLVKVLDPETGKVLHQYPPEEFLQVVKHLRNLKGMLFSAKL
jgi:flagellar protein FlaG